MERINLLVNKLKEQADAGADANVMLGTLELIQRELTKQSQELPKILGTTKVAVVLPAHYVVAQVETTPLSQLVAEEPLPISIPPQPVWEPVKESVPEFLGKYMPRPEVPAPPPSILTHNEPEKSPSSLFDRNVETGDFTFNDRLKQEKKELQHALQDSAIADLKKAIGINDRFLFINELFRGDEDMYERSLRTINNFNAYGEADFWISRELKLKLGWSNDNPLVQNFIQLVRRRFS